MFFRQRMTCARAEVKPTNFEKRRVFKERVFLGDRLWVLFLGNDRVSTPFERFPYFLLGVVLYHERREKRARADDLSLSVILHEY